MGTCGQRRTRTLTRPTTKSSCWWTKMLCECHIRPRTRESLDRQVQPRGRGRGLRRRAKARARARARERRRRRPPTRTFPQSDLLHFQREAAGAALKEAHRRMATATVATGDAHVTCGEAQTARRVRLALTATCRRRPSAGRLRGRMRTLVMAAPHTSARSSRWTISLSKTFQTIFRRHRQRPRKHPGRLQRRRRRPHAAMITLPRVHNRARAPRQGHARDPRRAHGHAPTHAHRRGHRRRQSRRDHGLPRGRRGRRRPPRHGRCHLGDRPRALDPAHAPHRVQGLARAPHHDQGQGPDHDLVRSRARRLAIVGRCRQKRHTTTNR
eukprot:Opistho-2@58908